MPYVNTPASANNTPANPTACTSTAWSSAVRVRKPATSRLGAKAITPDRGYVWRVGFMPTRPQAAAGWRIEPPVSVPVAATAMSFSCGSCSSIAAVMGTLFRMATVLPLTVPVGWVGSVSV